MSAATCACGKRIVRCNCGGTACPGWGHLPPAARHWCGRAKEDGQPQPVGSAGATDQPVPYWPAYLPTAAAR